MRTLLTVLLSLILATAVGASVTVGWKVAIESLAPDFRSDARFKKLEHAPGPSAFFETGDDLWDVSTAFSWPRGFRPTKTGRKGDEDEDPAALDASSGEWNWNGPPDGKWDGEWVVWNARSRMFIARGSWEDVRQIEAGLRFNGHLEVLRTKLELVEGGKPSRSLSFVSRSSEKSAIEADDFKIVAETHGRGRILINTIILSASWPSKPEGATWEVSTSLNLEHGERTRVAGYSSGADAWELFASSQRERLDGTPIALARWLEEQGGVIAWPVPEHREDSMLTRDLEGGYRMTLFWFGSSMPLQMVGPGQDIPSGSVEVPAEARDLLRGSVIDFRPHLALNEIKLDDAREFAGFDPVSEHLLVIARNQRMDQIDSLLSGFTRYPGECRWVETNPEAGGWRLTTLSGVKSSIARKKDGNTDLSFETELTLNANEDSFDLSYRLQPGSGQLLQSKGTFLINMPREAGSFTAADGREVKVVLTAGSEPW